MSRAGVAILATAACLAGTAGASPWTREDGRLFVSTKIDYFSADTGPDQYFRRIETSTYGEYGLFRRTAVVAKVNYGTSWVRDATGVAVASGFTEVAAYGQRTILRSDRDIASVRLGAVVPASAESGVRTAIASNGVEAEFGALYGRNIALRSMKLFAGAEASYRRNFGDGADQIRADVTLGAEPIERFLFLIEGFSTTSLRNEDAGGSDYDVYKAQASVVWRAAKHWRVQAGYNREFAGRNVALGQSYIVGLWSEF